MRVADRRERDGSRTRSVVALLALAAVAIMAVDSAGDSTPIEPLRGATSAVVSPVQAGLDLAAAPIRSLGSYVTTVNGLRKDNTALRDDNARLRAQLETAGVDSTRHSDLAAIATIAAGSGLQLVPARVVAIGAAQSFSRTVSISAGTADGVHADMTVLNADGLVGRVLRADAHSATVLLIIDAGSVVGGRLGSDGELGLCRGDGDLSGAGRLTLTTLDSTVTPRAGDSVVTWGSQDGTPYVAGVPIGSIQSVQASPRDSTTTAVVRPYVDFSALDTVAVVVSATQSSAAPAPSRRQGR
ncbi:MAG: rod shape-determining protein MreC [Nocardioidaceae bacterium]